MELPVKLHNNIVDFLTSLPNIHDHNSQRALIQSAGLDAQLQRKIDFSGPSEQFFQLLIRTLKDYGKLADDRDPIEAVLEAAKNYVGGNRQAECDQLIEELRAFSQNRRQIQLSNPYRGLFAFREEDERFFFGRDSYTQKLIAAVQNRPLVAVIGASGSGKSSVVYAGVFPELRRQGNWLISSFRPGDNPFQAVAKSLIPFLYSDELERLSHTKKLAEQLRSAEISLADVIARIIEKDGQSAKFLLFADQFEELYTPNQNDHDRRRFLDEFLATPGGQTSVYKIILTLRADFLGKALTYRHFADVLQEADIKLGPMNRDELRETIERPAKALDVAIEDGLSDRILDAVGDEPGNLPLLEFALTELWNRQSNGVLTHAAYEATGGVEQALASYAENVYNNLNEDEQTRAQRIFTQLVHPGEGTEDTRRVAVRADVDEANWELVIKLADARLVMTSSRSSNFSLPEQEQTEVCTPEDTVEVIHEALIQRWQRLRAWMDADREFRMWQERLRAVMPAAAKSYTEGELLRGTMLTTSDDWLHTRRHDLSHTEQHFIEQSLQTKKRTQRRKTIFWTSLFIAVIAVAVALFGLWRNAMDAQKRAEKAAVALQQETEKVKQERDQKEAERNKTLKTQSLFLADLARQQNERSSFTQAILLALEALPEDMNNPDRPYFPEAEVSLYEAVTRQREHFILQVHESWVNHAEFSPDGARIVTASRDGTARVWDAVNG